MDENPIATNTDIRSPISAAWMEVRADHGAMPANSAVAVHSITMHASLWRWGILRMSAHFPAAESFGLNHQGPCQEPATTDGSTRMFEAVRRSQVRRNHRCIRVIRECRRSGCFSTKSDNSRRVANMTSLSFAIQRPSRCRAAGPRRTPASSFLSTLVGSSRNLSGIVAPS